MDEEILSPFRTRGHDHDACVSDAAATAERLCLDRGARLTPLRRRVFELVWQEHRPVGAYELLEALRGDRPGVAPPTVYRALEFLLEHRLVHRIESLNAFIGCGDPSAPHAGQFLICRACRRVGELDDRAIHHAIAERGDRLGFAVEREMVEITGLCAECRRTGAGD